MKSRTRAIGVIAPLAIGLALSACDHPDAPAAPKNHADLVARMVSRASAPSNVSVVDFGTLPTPGPGAVPTAPLSCGDLISATFALRLDPDAVPTDSAAIGLNWHSGAVVGIDSEFVFVYAVGGAARALSDLRDIIGRCPTYQSTSDPDITHTYTSAGGPGHGDDSLRLREQFTLPDVGGQGERDAVLIRSGDVLIVVEEGPRRSTTPSGLDDLTELAWKAYAGR